MVHNHGPEEGPGLSCPERRLPDGRLQGRCMEEFEPYQVVFAHESLARRFEEWVNSFPGLKQKSSN